MGILRSFDQFGIVFSISLLWFYKPLSAQINRNPPLQPMLSLKVHVKES
uniref:Uncharacterized protein MANES_11G017100 n=1 Tax=Rhizophora mucronata TaxID=61149 RepID=A0A2P2LY24_RHIMU